MPCSPKLLVASILVGALFLTPISLPRIVFARVHSSSVRASAQDLRNSEGGRFEPCTERGNDDKRRDEGRGSDDDGCLAAGSSSGIVRGDFNADEIADLAVGVPGEDIDGILNAGAVHVIYGTTAGLSSTAGPGSQFFPKTINPFGDVRPGDGLGTAIASGDFNGDGASDLAVATPGGEVDGILRAGYVQVLYGSEAGLNLGGLPLQNISQRTLEVAETGDRFGQSLSWGDFNGDGFGDLAVGVPLEDVGSVPDAGAVQIMYGSETGLTGNQLWTQNTDGILDTSESGDNFGNALTAGDFNGDGESDLAVGVPNEDRELRTSSVTDIGAVSVLFGTESGGLTATFDQIWTQDTVDNTVSVIDSGENFDRFGSTLAAGDFNGDGLSDLAIGVPREDLGGITDTGAVNVLYASASAGALSAVGNQFLVQGNSNLTGTAESGDVLGSSLAAGDFNGDGNKDLAIGVPGNNNEFGTSINDLGAVNVIYGSDESSGLSLSGQEFFRPGRFGEPSGENGLALSDRFGSSLSAWDFNRDLRADLAIGVPGETVSGNEDAGAVVVLYSEGASGLFDGSAVNAQFWTQDSSGVGDLAEPNDGFGTALY
jgi:hypothetical protein